MFRFRLSTNELWKTSMYCNTIIVLFSILYVHCDIKIRRKSLLPKTLKYNVYKTTSQTFYLRWPTHQLSPTHYFVPGKIVEKLFTLSKKKKNTTIFNYFLDKFILMVFEIGPNPDKSACSS